MLQIAYESEKFPPGTVPNGSAELSVTWDDILWAAVTVGRPNRHHVFRHGSASVYEAIFRWSLVRMALEQSGRRVLRLRRTDAARTLDPSEKGAINYFLGIAFCKLFATKLLDTPWLLHLDVFRPDLDPVLTGRSRPDLVGLERGSLRWHAFECKGRISTPSAATKAKAKEQAERLISVNATACTLHVGAITHLRKDVLNFYWCDPAQGAKVLDVEIRSDTWMHYYRPVVEAVRSVESEKVRGDSNGLLVTIEAADVEVGIHPAVAKALWRGEWNLAHEVARKMSEELSESGFQADGIKIVAGQSWTKRFEEPGASVEG